MVAKYFNDLTDGVDIAFCLIRQPDAELFFGVEPDFKHFDRVDAEVAAEIHGHFQFFGGEFYFFDLFQPVAKGCQYPGVWCHGQKKGVSGKWEGRAGRGWHGVFCVIQARMSAASSCSCPQ